VGEARAAVHVGVVVAVAVLLVWVAFTGSAELERMFAIMPDRSFVAQLVKQPAPIEIKAIIYEEEETALEADIDRAVALWSEDGSIRDLNFTPDDSRDDRVWSGREAIRQRYQQEFARRRYLRLAHQAIEVVVDGDKAWARNDLEATLWAEPDVEHVRLQGSDWWALRRNGRRWKIVDLTVNSVPR
jgi:hypothetical protein